jgi:ABC-type branched-subunit amino acid transport system ATPase component
MAATAMILSVKDLSAGYGSVPVLRKVGFEQASGEILGIVGHNGMGKTTLLRALMGLLRMSEGSVRLGGDAIEAVAAHRRSRLGISYVPQGEKGFPALTVIENLKLATTMKGPRPHRTIDEIMALFPRLDALTGRRSSALSGGERQLLAIACAVVRSPSLLLLDELTEGVQPSIVEEIAKSLFAIQRQTAMSILLVDQELAFVSSLATRVLVMQKGQIAKEVAARDLSNPDILGGFGNVRAARHPTDSA